MENIPQTTHSTTFLEKSEQDEQVAHYIHQCFAVQNAYEKTPEQLKTLMQVLILDLSQYQPEAVQKSFEEWRKVSRKIPTPKDMIDLAEKHTPKSKALTFAESNMSWSEYKKYLNEFL